jgi:LytS/YehU family sensor histidine kinase
MGTRPDMLTPCAVSAGIHTARIGGTTQTPSFVSTVITP